MLLVLVVILFTSLFSAVTAAHNESTQLKPAAAASHQLHRNLVRTSPNASFPIASITNTETEITQTPWWQPLIQFVVTGLVAGAALLGANVVLDKYRSPKLSVDKANSPKIVRIDLTVYKIDEKLIPYHLRQFTVPYNVNRILIRNEGKSAAKNCKGVLKVDYMEYRVCWSVPTERSTATLNAHSMEYLDLAAGLVGTQAEDLREFCKKIIALKDHIDNIKDVYLKRSSSI